MENMDMHVAGAVPQQMTSTKPKYNKDEIERPTIGELHRMADAAAAAGGGQKRTTTYDHKITENGKTTHSEIVTVQEGEPQFVKVYLDCVMAFKGLSKSLNPILLELLGCMTYANRAAQEGGQLIYLNAQLKRDIAAKLGITTSRISQAITDFVKSGVLTRIATSTYQANPYLFGRGPWKEVSRLRAEFVFDATNNTNNVRTEVEYGKVDDNNVAG